MHLKKDNYYISRVLEGKTCDFKYLIDKYKDMIFTLAFRITGNKEDAEEVAQDVFLKAYRGLEAFRGTSKFSTWLYKIAYNHSVSRIRKKQPDIQSYDSMEITMDEWKGETDINLERMDNIPVKYIRQAFEKLEETERAVLTMFYQDELSVKEISHATGLSISNVKVKLFRGRKKLTDTLKRILKTELIDLIS
ncbi:MAG: sigma-70 family RNA polymerase sigma factor [Bacteroidales bacterium]|nr:sigma-70 family RNA polymerase sigma factor [Bacteroidales bacterium]